MVLRGLEAGAAGNRKSMRINKVVRKTSTGGPDEGAPGTKIAAGISAVVAVNVGDDGKTGSNQVYSSRHVRIVQRAGQKTSPREGSES